MSGTLEQRVSALEQALAGLQGSEANQPNYLTIDPKTGLVTADFAGTVSAQGISLPTALASRAVAAVNNLQWLLNNQVTSSIGGSRYQHAPPTGPLDSTLTIEAVDPTTNTQAQLVLDALTNGYASVQALTGGAQGSVTIINSNGGSSFILNGSDSLCALAFGTATINFAGTTTGAVTVTHNLGRTPVLALAGSIQGAIGVNASFSPGTFTTTQMTIDGYAQTAPGGPFTIGWVALG